MTDERYTQQPQTDWSGEYQPNEEPLLRPVGTDSLKKREVAASASPKVVLFSQTMRQETPEAYPYESFMDDDPSDEPSYIAKQYTAQPQTAQPLAADAPAGPSQQPPMNKAPQPYQPTTPQGYAYEYNPGPYMPAYGYAPQWTPEGQPQQPAYGYYAQAPGANPWQAPYYPPYGMPLPYGYPSPYGMAPQGYPQQQPYPQQPQGYPQQQPYPQQPAGMPQQQPHPQQQPAGMPQQAAYQPQAQPQQAQPQPQPQSPLVSEESPVTLETPALAMTRAVVAEPVFEEPVDVFEEPVAVVAEPVVEPVDVFEEPVAVVAEPVVEPVDVFEEPVAVVAEPVVEPVDVFEGPVAVVAEPVVEPAIEEPIGKAFWERIAEEPAVASVAASAVPLVAAAVQQSSTRFTADPVAQTKATPVQAPASRFVSFEWEPPVDESAETETPAASATPVPPAAFKEAEAVESFLDEDSLRYAPVTTPQEWPTPATVPTTPSYPAKKKSSLSWIPGVLLLALIALAGVYFTGFLDPLLTQLNIPVWSSVLNPAAETSAVSAQNLAVASDTDDMPRVTLAPASTGSTGFTGSTGQSALPAGDRVAGDRAALSSMTVAPDRITVPGTFTITLVSNTATGDIRLIKAKKEPLSATVTTTPSEDGLTWIFTVSFETPYEGEVRALLQGTEKGEWYDSGFSCQIKAE